MNMKYLHIMLPLAGSPHKLISFFKRNFPLEEHTFLIMQNKDVAMARNPLLLEFPDLLYLPAVSKWGYKRRDRMLYVKHLIDSAEHVVWHSYFCIGGNFLLMLCCLPWYIKKYIWISTKQDVFNWRQPDFGFKRKIKNKLLRRLRAKTPNIAVSLPSDKAEVESLGAHKAKYFYIPQPLSIQRLQLAKQMAADAAAANKDCPMVWIGYGGLLRYQHRDLLDLLSVFSQEKFRIICPISWELFCEGYEATPPLYYNLLKSHAAKVGLKGHLSLINKRELADKDYFKVLALVDAAVFEAERPTEMDLLFYLLVMGKKVFLPADSPLYSFLTDFGFTIFDTSSIQNIEFDEFIKQPFENENAALVFKYADEYSLKEKWQNLFLEVNGA